MRDFRDAKAMAQTLRGALKTKSVSLSHSESLEIVAKALGVRDWNALAAAIEASRPADASAFKAAAQAAGNAVLPMIPLRDIVVFPQMVIPLFVGRDKTRRAIECALAGDERLLVVTQRRSGDDDPARDDLYPVGVTAKLVQRTPLDGGTLKIFVSGLQRASIARLIDSDFLSAEIAAIDDIRDERTEETLALSREITEAYHAYDKSPASHFLGLSTERPGQWADIVAPMLRPLSPGIDRMQQILETADVVRRLEMILEVMKAGRQAKA